MSLRQTLVDAGHIEGEDFTIEKEHVIAIDVSCSCGAKLVGAWSGEEVDAWHEAHQRRAHD
jgi:hypothetical protein